jgi:NAD(P)H-quinone oxidoreductase subunit 5
MRNLPEGLGTLGISPDINSFTILMLILVALVGLVVTRYASTYLDGDSREGRFHQWLSLTLGSFLLMMACGNMWTFLILWIASSLCLHQLLAFYRDRPGALLTARKKYLLDRIADVSLFSAIVLVTRTLHSSQFASIAPELSRMHGALPNTLQIASALLVISAVLKSAQFPFHGWLIQVMEAPTPVSALLHAGIIYTGAFLLLRMVPLMSRVIWTGDTVVVIGLCSVFSGSLMMMTATNIKGALAYSTYAQMGFMLMEWGLGLYSLAVLHIVSHAVYKAHAFLSSGSVVDHFRAPMLPTKRPDRIMGPIISSLAIAGLIVIGTEAGFGMLLP